MTSNLARPSTLAAEPESVEPRPAILTPGVPVRKFRWEKVLLEHSVRSGMTPSTQQIALVLATYANGAGSEIHPSVGTLARVSGRAEGTVQKARQFLRENGWLIEVERGGSSGTETTVYQLSIPEGIEGGVESDTQPDH